MDEQIKHLRQENAQGRAQTEALVKALRKPQVRGRWGELQLRKAVELADMRERCDFDTQVTVTGEEGTQRPDMVVNLTSGRRVVVDAKVSLDAFMNALEADGDAEHDRFMEEHAAQVRKHVDALAAKEYFARVAGSPDFVLMFLPNESLLQAALDRRPDLYEHALAKKIIIATPTVLIPMLRTIALSWDEKAMRENTEVIHELGREIYDRLTKVGEYLGRLRGSLDSSVKHYNEAIASLEGRVLPTARKFPELGVRPKKELVELHPVERRPRETVAQELVASAATALDSGSMEVDPLDCAITPTRLRGRSPKPSGNGRSAVPLGLRPAVRPWPRLGGHRGCEPRAGWRAGRCAATVSRGVRPRHGPRPGPKWWQSRTIEWTRRSR